jgi:NDP-sugar pyrophosphorylase family protein
MIPALVLTAGLATRLRPLSLVRAKAALPVAGEPLARRILRSLAAAGVTDAVLNLHHLPHTLTARIGDGSDIGVRVRYSWEVPVLGSAGGPKRAMPLLGSSPVLMINGDTLTNAPISDLVAAHAGSGAQVTLAVVPNATPEKYSGLAVDARGHVTGLIGRGSSTPSFHFIGLQVAEAEAFAGVPANTPYESVGALYPSLIAARPGSVRAHIVDAEFLDIGTPADYLDTATMLAIREGGGLQPGARADIHPTARLDGTIVWDDVTVEAGVSLRDCIVADGVTVPADTSWHGVTIRVATGELAAGERRIDGLAVAAL